MGKETTDGSVIYPTMPGPCPNLHTIDMTRSPNDTYCYRKDVRGL